MLTFYFFLLGKPFLIWDRKWDLHMPTLTIKFPKASNSALCSGPMLSSPKSAFFFSELGTTAVTSPTAAQERWPFEEEEANIPSELTCLY